ncbi:hypothetical protein VP01_310g9 [Puccinia sorghi]|uniref:Uncharacterized protein n=1 Tax=Puccinia sorghi TaxID=27349 RepID=A0A0L6UZC4_9BASI|nr:hypothetical protein VP01_310g9 [Puccinia sorghi]
MGGQELKLGLSNGGEIPLFLSDTLFRSTQISQMRLSSFPSLLKQLNINTNQLKHQLLLTTTAATTGKLTHNHNQKEAIIPDPPHIPSQSQQPITSLPDSLVDFLHSLQSQDFHSTLTNYHRLTPSQTSRLSSHVYDSLFVLAAQVLPQDKTIIGSTSMPDQYHQENLLGLTKPYAIDYCKLQDRLTQVDQLFLQTHRSLSTQHLHFYLQNTILAAALKLRKLYQSSELETASDDHSKELFLHSRDLISNIIQRLPALQQVPTPTAEQLAQAIPFEILGLYARFLAVFHQPQLGLKLMRKIYYAYLIGRRQNVMNQDQQQSHETNNDQAQSSILSAIETGSLITSLLRHKTHHRLAALKLAARMITIGGIYPDQSHLASLLRRMYMSKPEWNSTVTFIAQLSHGSASRWLLNQVAIVEAEDGRVERVLNLSAEALELPPRLQGDFLAPATLCPEIFSHAIQALVDNPDSLEANSPTGLRGAIAIRTRMLESGILPDCGSDDLILRRISCVAQDIKSPVTRHEFLVEMIGGMFPTSKIVPMRSDPLRSFKFASHPGRSPEAFRLMRWLMKSNELDLALHVFQSISRYGYVCSLAGIPFSYLKRLLDKALHCHPELAMELYQHLHMAGSDRSGELMRAVKQKAIEMGDHRLAEYLLKSLDDQNETRQAARITSFLTGFARRRATPGNVAKTISLFDSVWTRWSFLIENNVWLVLWEQIQRLGPVKLAQRPELRPQIDRVLGQLDEADMDPIESTQIKKKLMECIHVSQLIEQDPELMAIDSQIPKPRTTKDLLSLRKGLTQDSSGVNSNLSSKIHQIRTFEDLIEEYVGEKRLSRAVRASMVAAEMSVVIPGPLMGRLLNALVDELMRDADLTRRRDESVHIILSVNQAWRAVAWKVRSPIRGSDINVVRAMHRLYQLTSVHS